MDVCHSDDALGHAKIREGLKGIMGVATGEHAHNRMTFKQLLQAQAIDVCQIDSVSRIGLVFQTYPPESWRSKVSSRICERDPGDSPDGCQVGSFENSSTLGIAELYLVQDMASQSVHMPAAWDSVSSSSISR
jgi:hypothetical protein